MRPERAEHVWKVQCCRILNSDELALERLPEVEAVVLRLQRPVLHLQSRDVIRHRKPSIFACVKRRERCDRRDAVLAQDDGLDAVSGRVDVYLRGTLYFGQEEVVGSVRGPVLCHSSGDRDEVSGVHATTEAHAVYAQTVRDAWVI